MLYEIQPTPYGGRGAFAPSLIPQDTEILSCAGPYASVVLRKFKKEVCILCFAYAFQSGRSKWTIKPPSDIDCVGIGSGLWFCSETCRDEWAKMYEIRIGEGGTWFLELCVAFERRVVEMGKIAIGKQGCKSVDSDVKADVITLDFLDQTWALAEETTPPGIKKSARSGWTGVLNEIELDTARFLLDGMSRRALEASAESHETELSSGRWSEFLELQNNELVYVRLKPYILSSQIRIYHFLNQLVSDFFPRNKVRQPEASSPILLLREYLKTSAVVRALLGRDPGNVFGIWELTPDEQDSEMLGWGTYVFGSYFNHSKCFSNWFHAADLGYYLDCDPNIKKRRTGRGVQFYTLRDIRPGEELCISYAEDCSVEERAAQLQEWFFVCRCRRCAKERDQTVSTVILIHKSASHCR